MLHNFCGFGVKLPPNALHSLSDLALDYSARESLSLQYFDVLISELKRIYYAELFHKAFSCPRIGSLFRLREPTYHSSSSSSLRWPIAWYTKIIGSL